MGLTESSKNFEDMKSYKVCSFILSELHQKYKNEVKSDKQEVHKFLESMLYIFKDLIREHVNE